MSASDVLKAKMAEMEKGVAIVGTRKRSQSAPHANSSVGYRQPVSSVPTTEPVLELLKLLAAIKRYALSHLSLLIY